MTNIFQLEMKWINAIKKYHQWIKRNEIEMKDLRKRGGRRHFFMEEKRETNSMYVSGCRPYVDGSKPTAPLHYQARQVAGNHHSVRRATPPQTLRSLTRPTVGQPSGTATARDAGGRRRRPSEPRAVWSRGRCSQDHNHHSPPPPAAAGHQRREWRPPPEGQLAGAGQDLLPPSGVLLLGGGIVGLSATKLVRDSLDSSWSFLSSMVNCG